MGQPLYKYCVINKYTIENLANNQLYFNSPDNFNDPYEGVFNFCIKSDDIAHKLLKLFYEHKYNNLISSNKSVDTLLIHTKIEYINYFLHEMKICCMSYIKDSILLWSHYSGNHEGICIEFDTNETLFQIGSKVHYSDEISKFIFNSDDDVDAYKVTQKYSEIIATKYIQWQYEEEYRLFSQYFESKVKYNPQSLKAIYFGLRCSKENREHIMSILAYYKHIRYYQADLNIDSYKMRFLECT